MSRYTGTFGLEDNDLNITLNAEHEGEGNNGEVEELEPTPIEEPAAVDAEEPIDLEEGDELSQALESLQLIYDAVSTSNDLDVGNESYLQLLNVSVDNAVRKLGTNAAELNVASVESHVFHKQVSLEKIGEAIANGLKTFWEWVKKIIKSIGERIKGWFSKKSTVEGKAAAADKVVSEFESEVKSGNVQMIENKSGSSGEDSGPTTVYQLGMREKRQPGSSKPEPRETGSKEPILMGTTVKPEQKIKVKLPAYFTDVTAVDKSLLRYDYLVGSSSIIYQSISGYLNRISNSISNLAEQLNEDRQYEMKPMSDKRKAVKLIPNFYITSEDELFGKSGKTLYMGVTLTMTDDGILRGYIAKGDAARVECEMTTKEMHKAIDYMKNGWVTRNIPRMESQMKSANESIGQVIKKAEKYIEKFDNQKDVTYFKEHLNHALKQLTNIEMIVNLLLRNYEVLLNAIVKATKVK